MCKKQKGLHNRIDKCMKNFIPILNNLLPEGYKIVACCCGHFKYPMTIIIKTNWAYYDLVSNKKISRTRNFYKKDKQGYYYIKEVMEDIC